jgi:hypothetical protein
MWARVLTLSAIVLIVAFSTVAQAASPQPTNRLVIQAALGVNGATAQPKKPCATAVNKGGFNENFGRQVAVITGGTSGIGAESYDSMLPPLQCLICLIMTKSPFPSHPIRCSVCESGGPIVLVTPHAQASTRTRINSYVRITVLPSRVCTESAPRRSSFPARCPVR